MQKITDQLIHETVTQQRTERHRTTVSTMHRIHNAPTRAASAVQQDQGTDVDLAAILALLAPILGPLTIVKE